MLYPFRGAVERSHGQSERRRATRRCGGFFCAVVDVLGSGGKPACYNDLMKLPHGDRALVEDAKLRDYVLNPRHPIGRHHAALFERLLGIHLGNAEILKDALLRAAVDEDVTHEVVTPYGRKFEMPFLLPGPVGARRVLSVWIVDQGRDRPRLVTCYVE